MTAIMRGRGIIGWIAVAVPLALVSLAVVAWNDAGREPVRDLAVPVAVPAEAPDRAIDPVEAAR